MSKDVELVKIKDSSVKLAELQESSIRTNQSS
jgi:hypothetical protein